MKRTFLQLALLVCLGTSTLATPALAGGTKPAPAPAKTARRLTAPELAQITRDAIATSGARLPKGANLTSVRPTAAIDVPTSHDRVSIEVTPAPRRAGSVTTAAVLTFWRATDVVARLPVLLELAVAPEAMVFDVTKGSTLTVVVRRGLVEISAPAVLGADADVGDVVQVLLRPSGRALRAQLIARDRAVAVEENR